MFDKLFGGPKKPAAEPNIPFGRYSDNNKSMEKTSRWTDADNLYKEKKYYQSMEAFFDYLRDDAADNVVLQGNSNSFNFQIYQGSKIVRGTGNSSHLQAEVSLAKMPQPSVPVMRRLLEQNFLLYYSRYSLDGDRLCMRFDSDMETANPNKLYYALKELATKADKQDDQLVQDFSSLQSLDTDHAGQVPAAEMETKFAFMQKWIAETLDYIKTLDADKFSGGISYLLLVLSFRLDYLICPEGSFRIELEKIPVLYFTKDEKPATEKNEAMIAGFKNLLAKTKEEFAKNLYRTRSCFAIGVPQTHKTIADAINAANTNMLWYRDNNYTYIGQQISEYGFSYCQYSYSLPKPLSELFLVLMRVNYSDYFTSLGFADAYYEADKNKFNERTIIEKINSIISSWRKKYPLLDFKTQNLRFDSLLSFNHSYTTEIELLNFDAK
ncbi:MAG: hypothetical protein ACKOU7_13305 [Ferruginibacter sp.]